VSKPLVMPDGLELVTGTKIAFPLFAVHGDDEVYSHPDDFDPYRFLKHPDLLSHNINDEFLTFGYGPHVSSDAQTKFCVLQLTSMSTGLSRAVGRHRNDENGRRIYAHAL
jgi:cytochrome P450